MTLTRRLVGLLFIFTAGLAVTCGPVAPPAAPQSVAPAGFGGAEGESASGDQCVVPKGDTEPFVVEWDAAKRNKVKQLSTDGVLLAVHSGCGLTFLDGCGVGGGYDNVQAGDDKTADSFDIGSATQLKSRLPIGYFELYGKFKKDDRWTLEYVYANSKKAKSNLVKRSELPPQCAQATHYVSRIMLGAYRLRSAAAQGGAAGATVKDVGVTVESGSDAEVIRQGGEFESCKAKETPGDDGACQAIVQIYLREIYDDGPVGATTTSAPAPSAPAPTGREEAKSSSTSYYDTLNAEGPPSPASTGKVSSDKQYRSDLEKAWAAVKKAVKSASPDRQLEMYQRFLTDFPVDNPYADKARKEVTRLDAALTKQAEADAKAAAKAATLAAEKEKAELMRQAYEAAKNSTGSASERLAMWKRFVEAYPGSDNPYLSTAKRMIASLTREVEENQLTALAELQRLAAARSAHEAEERERAAKSASTAGVEWINSSHTSIRFTKTEITVAQYRACVTAGLCPMPTNKNRCNWFMTDRDRHPMNCLERSDAIAVCSWLGGRLPTQEEWDNEASNGGSRLFPWGDSPNCSCDYAVMWEQHSQKSSMGCGNGGTAPVCSRPRGNNYSGLCDMAGNVSEWTAGYARGGHWLDYDQLALRASSTRGATGSPVGSYVYGVRCVRPSQASEAVTSSSNPTPNSSNATAEVQQSGTNLYWLRCPLGQEWSGSTCSGEVKKITRKTAMSACPSGYRLPTRREFIDLLGDCDSDVRNDAYGYCKKCSESRKCSKMFTSDTNWYWSSSEYNDENAWVADFNTGQLDKFRVVLISSVRCVRSVQ
jgi:formylglycine-generating enzyme required for sulfatase activity